MNNYYPIADDMKIDNVGFTVDAPHRILIVEDNIIIAMDLASFFKNNGFQIVGFVQNGEEAVELAIETRPEIIIMDVDLSGFFDGVAAARVIQKKYHPKIIFASAYPNDDSRIRGFLKKSGNTFIRKPYDNNNIMREINRLHL